MLQAMVPTTTPLPEGKLAREQLLELLRCTSQTNPDILVGAAAGEDAAVVRGVEHLVVTADPITFTEENIGVYTVAVNCNDIVAMGGRPRYLTTTVLLPPGTTEARLRTLFTEIAEACGHAGILWVGGHTEVTGAVTRIVVSAQAIGFLSGRPTRTSDAAPGEALIMSKWAALEATTLIARDRPEECRRLLGEEGYREVIGWLFDPGISILREGELLQGLPLSAAHDPTEGGIATGIHEIAFRSGVGVRVYRERIPVRPETATLCRHFGLDPLGALSSGVFLFTAPPEVAAQACERLSRGGIGSAVIGDILPAKEEVLLADGSRSGPLPMFTQDEIIRALRALPQRTS
jgi:hydrogenase expression/formation protein HypE